jgi:hypothetical protein
MKLESAPSSAKVLQLCGAVWLRPTYDWKANCLICLVAGVGLVSQAETFRRSVVHSPGRMPVYDAAKASCHGRGVTPGGGLF